MNDIITPTASAVTVAFDLTRDGRCVDGTITFDNGRIYIAYPGYDGYQAGLTDVAEIKQITYVGCGSLELVYADSSGENKTLGSECNRELCRFSMTHVNIMAEFVKLVNYWIETGESTSIAEKVGHLCPDCGRPYMVGMETCIFCLKKTAFLSKAGRVMKPFFPKLIASSLILALAGGFNVLQPLFTGKLIDFLDSRARLPLITTLFGQLSDVMYLVAITGFTIAIFIAAQVCLMISSRISNRAGSAFSNKMRSETYAKIQQLSMSSLGRKTTGDLQKRITQDTMEISGFMTDWGRWGVEQVLMLAIVAVILFTSNWKLALMVLVPLPLTLYVIYFFWGYIFVRFEKQWRLSSRANSILHDIIKGIRVVKVFGNEKREIERFEKANRDYADISVSNEQLWARTFPCFAFFIGIGEFFVLYFGGRAVRSGEMSLGQLVQFMLLTGLIYEPLRWITNLPRWIAAAATSMIKLFEILDEQPDIRDIEQPVSPVINGGITFDNVTFGYKTYEPVLKNVSLDIRPGEMIGLVGHSGAGKTTMINLAMRLYDANRGSVLFDGVNIADIEQACLHEQIGVVFQETFLFTGTVFENIAYARGDATPVEVIRAAKAANAHEFIIALPDAYNTMIGENGHNLSGGERQRLAIARAVLKDPKVLILDEATSSLDPETETKIQQALNRLIENRTTIAIAHRLSTLRNANRLVVLENGRISEIGTHEQLLKQRGIYFNLVMAQKQTAKIAGND